MKHLKLKKYTRESSNVFPNCTVALCTFNAIQKLEVSVLLGKKFERIGLYFLTMKNLLLARALKVHAAEIAHF